MTQAGPIRGISQDRHMNTGRENSLSAKVKLDDTHLSDNFPKPSGKNASVVKKGQHKERSRAERQRKKDANDIV